MVTLEIGERTALQIFEIECFANENASFDKELCNYYGHNQLYYLSYDVIEKNYDIFESKL